MLATIEAKIIVVFAVIGLLAIMFGAGYFYGEKAKGAKDALQTAQEHLAIAKVIQTSLEQNDALKTQLLEQKNERDKVVDYLANSHPASGLQLPARSCISKAKPPADSQPAGNGPLPIDPQIAFGKFTEGLDKLALEADQLTEQCRLVMGWAKSIH